MCEKPNLDIWWWKIAPFQVHKHENKHSERYF
uniref:Uncharacterized protein n=1 Tax=Rhizophora mucronata TaxID=61149 RepID=A0A2P2IKZ1_RHIMU